MAWALVTGASSGIGRSIAVKLSERYSVVLGGRDAGRLEETKAMCSPGSEVLCWAYDVSNLEGLAQQLPQFLSEHGIVIDSFVHAAGYSKLVPIKMTTAEQMHVTFNTNVHAPLVIVQQLINRRVNQGGLRNVVLISSNISDHGAKGFVVYGSSKHAVDGLMRGLAVELAPKIRVNSVRPGAIKTRMTEQVFADLDVVERMKANYPLGLGEAANVADAVDFLLSDKASWITGQTLAVDGGATVDISV